MADVEKIPTLLMLIIMNLYDGGIFAATQAGANVEGFIILTGKSQNLEKEVPLVSR